MTDGLVAKVKVGNVEIGGGALPVFIAGPCVIEDREAMIAAIDGMLAYTEHLAEVVKERAETSR